MLRTGFVHELSGLSPERQDFLSKTMVGGKQERFIIVGYDVAQQTSHLLDELAGILQQLEEKRITLAVAMNSIKGKTPADGGTPA